MTTTKPELSGSICRRAIACWGKERQCDMIVEEAAELAKAMVKYRRYDHAEERRLHCIEEAADMSIMLDQLILMLSSNEEFEKIRRYKLQRLSKLLDCEMENQTCENDECHSRCVR
jgi:hypothetical protein